ncbi:MAG: hypothetical protein WCA64_06750 [Gallionella sp.]
MEMADEAGDRPEAAFKQAEKPLFVSIRLVLVVVLVHPEHRAGLERNETAIAKSNLGTRAGSGADRLAGIDFRPFAEQMPAAIRHNRFDITDCKFNAARGNAISR